MAQNIAKSKLEMVISTILTAGLEDRAINRPPCWRRSQSNLAIILTEEPKNTSKLLMSVFKQVSMKNSKEIELEAHIFKNS